MKYLKSISIVTLIGSIDDNKALLQYNVSINI